MRFRYHEQLCTVDSIDELGDGYLYTITARPSFWQRLLGMRTRRIQVWTDRVLCLRIHYKYEDFSVPRFFSFPDGTEFPEGAAEHLQLAKLCRRGDREAQARDAWLGLRGDHETRPKTGKRSRSRTLKVITCALGIVGCEERRLHFHASAPGLPAVPMKREWMA